MKKSLVFILLGVFLLSIFAVGLVSAEEACYNYFGDPEPAHTSQGACEDIGFVWEDPDAGSDSAATTPPEEDVSETSLADLLGLDGASNLRKWFVNFEGEGGLSGIFVKYLFLALIIVLVFSSLSFADFPESSSLRFVISLIVALLATTAIDPKVLITMVKSYEAMGLALGLFFPIMILGFFTMVVATKMNPIGILIQKILWLIYTVYLFVTSGGSLLLQSGIPFFKDPGFGVKILGALGIATETGGAQGDQVILVILFVSSIVLFYFTVVKPDMMIEWFAHSKRQADVSKYKDTAKRSRAAREVDADLTRAEKSS